MPLSPDPPAPDATPAFHDFAFSAADGTSLQGRVWPATSEPRSVVALVHGYAEHIGRYAHVAAYLVERGHAVYGYDQRGHGRSPGPRAYIDAFDTYVGDLAVFLDHVRDQVPGRPLFLLGHSMGGAVSAQYALRDEASLDGLILSSAALDLPTPPALQALAWLLGRLVPRLPTVKLDRHLISRDAAVIAQTDADPLYYRGGIPARTAAELFGAARHLRQHLEELTLPLLLLHGTADGITRPRGSQACYARARSTDKTLALYPGLYHETFNEPEKARVLKEVAEWLDEHLQGAA